MPKLISALQRFILKQRIEMLRSDVALAYERRDQMLRGIERLDEWAANAQKKLRKLNARLFVLDHPNTLLAEALRHE